MPRVFAYLLPGTCVAILVACGVTVQPRVSEPAPAVGRLPGLPSDPERPDVSPQVQPAVHSMVEQICRSAAMPRGWIAVRYTIDPSACPKPVESDNPYTLAVIHRYLDLPVGAALTVCADQVRPWGWQRDTTQAPGDVCRGARVENGTPTAYVMYRVH